MKNRDCDAEEKAKNQAFTAYQAAWQVWVDAVNGGKPPSVTDPLEEAANILRIHWETALAVWLECLDGLGGGVGQAGNVEIMLEPGETIQAMQRPTLDRSEFQGVLIELRGVLRNGSWPQRTQAFRVSRILNNRRRLERVYQEALKQFLASPQASEIGDGNILEIFLEWLSNGGWEIILEIIKRFF